MFIKDVIMLDPPTESFSKKPKIHQNAKNLPFGEGTNWG